MSQGRTLRSKKLRAALWRMTGGKCAQCGIDLADEWHADHVIAWVKTKTTNVHEMQPLCRVCNLKKGSK
jgi:5-methylcytosine-specific restriction endonuclease McrA